MSFVNLNREPILGWHNLPREPLAQRLERAMARELERLRAGAEPEPQVFPVHPDEFAFLLKAGTIDDSGRVLP